MEGDEAWEAYLKTMQDFEDMRETIRDLAEALENYQSFPIVDRVLTKHAATIKAARGE